MEQHIKLFSGTDKSTAIEEAGRDANRLFEEGQWLVKQMAIHDFPAPFGSSKQYLPKCLVIFYRQPPHKTMSWTEMKASTLQALENKAKNVFDDTVSDWLDE